MTVEVEIVRVRGGVFSSTDSAVGSIERLKDDLRLRAEDDGARALLTRQSSPSHPWSPETMRGRCLPSRRRSLLSEGIRLRDGTTPATSPVAQRLAMEDTEPALGGPVGARKPRPNAFGFDGESVAGFDGEKTSPPAGAGRGRDGVGTGLGSGALAGGSENTGSLSPWSMLRTLRRTALLRDGVAGSGRTADSSGA